jgi:hypothetical protein
MLRVLPVTEQAVHGAYEQTYRVLVNLIRVADV